MRAAAFGLRVHSGWAAVVAVAASDQPATESSALTVLERRRIICIDEREPALKHPYHHVERMDLAQAAAYLDHCRSLAEALAGQGLRAVRETLAEKGASVIGAGVVTGSGKPLPELVRILASHPLIHTAEGELFRAVFESACQAIGVPIR